MVVRSTVFFKRREGISAEEFHEYWSKSHPSVFLSVPVARKNLIRYSQFHVDSKIMIGLAETGLKGTEYDGASSFWTESIEKFQEIFTDPEYLKVVVPDEMKFLNREEAVFMIGWDEEKYP